MDFFGHPLGSGGSRSADKPCFWRLSESGTKCSKEYMRLVGLFVDQEGSLGRITEDNQRMASICWFVYFIVSSNNNNQWFITIWLPANCCLSILSEFMDFSRCALRDTSLECSIEIDDFVNRFLFKLGGKKIVDQCRPLKMDSVYKAKCSYRQQPINYDYWPDGYYHRPVKVSLMKYKSLL